MKQLLFSAALAAMLSDKPLARADEPLVDYVVENGASIMTPLTDWTGAPSSGAAIFASVGCADCHAAPSNVDAPAIGPDLHGVGARLTDGEIRLMIVNPTIVSPETDMPAYYAIGVLGDDPEELVGKTRLSAIEVEKLVAWLATLSTPR